MQAISVVTLGVADLAASRRFYVDGFGWTPAYEADDIAFYQMNGLVFGTFRRSALEDDMGGGRRHPHGAFTLAHNLPEREAVRPLIERLVAAGGSVIRAADVPPHGGLRGYVADPDGHAWEIAWNPTFAMDADGRVTFGL